MPNNNWQAYLEIAELVLKYGVPMVKKLIATWRDDMTPDEIRAKVREYQDKLKEPEEYFK